MGLINLETIIKAPIERCFDLSRSIDLHMASSNTEEKAIAGVVTGLINLGETVTWRARHFGVMQTLTSKITEFDRPNHFRDSQLSGIFKYFDHDHFFESAQDHTLMREVFKFECPLGFLGTMADPLVENHLRKFLLGSNETIKMVAEGDEWIEYL